MHLKILIPAALITPSLLAQEPVVQIAPADAYEIPAVLVAPEILQPDIVNGPHHAVRLRVPTYAGHNHYLIDSDFGVLSADGNTMLAERVAEIRAMAALREFSKTEQYGKALEAAARSPIQLAENLVSDPVNTITGVPKGIWKFMNRAGQAIKESSEESQRSPYEDSALEGMIGFSKVKRDLANTLGVDPYSSNEILQRELNSVAWASFGGKMTFTAALMPLGGVAGAVATGVQISDASIRAITDLSPLDLRMRNLNLLLDMGISRADAEDFLALGAFSPTRATLVVEALSGMPGVAGRELFLRNCSVAINELDAVFLQRTIQALARMHMESPLERVGVFHGFPYGVTSDGTVLLAIEWDYASWTPQVQIFLSELLAEMNKNMKVQGLTIALTGNASPTLRDVFAKHGYRLVEKCLPGPLAN